MLALDAARSAGAGYGDVRITHGNTERWPRASGRSQMSAERKPTASAFARWLAAPGDLPRRASSPAMLLPRPQDKP